MPPVMFFLKTLFKLMEKTKILRFLFWTASGTKKKLKRQLVKVQGGDAVK